MTARVHIAVESLSHMHRNRCKVRVAYWGECLYERVTNCVADLCKNSLWSQQKREKMMEKKRQQRRQRKRDWNIFYVKTELENDGQLFPPLQHLIPSSQLSFFDLPLSSQNCNDRLFCNIFTQIIQPELSVRGEKKCYVRTACFSFSILHF